MLKVLYEITKVVPHDEYSYLFHAELSEENNEKQHPTHISFILRKGAAEMCRVDQAIEIATDSVKYLNHISTYYLQHADELMYMLKDINKRKEGIR